LGDSNRIFDCYTIAIAAEILNEIFVAGGKEHLASKMLSSLMDLVKEDIVAIEFSVEKMEKISR